MGLSWEEIEQAAAQKNENAGKFFEAGEAELKKWLKPVEDNRLNLTEQEVESEPSERIRRKTKYLLSAALENYEDAMQQDDDLAAIFEFAKQYADMQVTATYGDYKTEFDLSKKIYKGLKDYQDKLDIELMNEDEPGYSYYERQTVTANLLSYFENLRDGELIVPMDEKERKNAYFVDGVKHAPSSDFWKKDERQSDDAPLFSHAPNGNDVSQGALGDCYLLAPLSAIAETHPEIIRQSMVDHGDGTVTVRFYTRDKYDNFTPVYVTVEKVVPQNMHGNDAFAHDSMWVQTYERAWAASGLQQSRSDGVYGRPVPENIDEIYNRLLEKKKNKTLSAYDEELYPWLFDKNNNLQKWKPSYSAISGGGSEYVTQCIMGPAYCAEIKKDSPVFRRNMKDGFLDVTALGKKGLAYEVKDNWNLIHVTEKASDQKLDVIEEEMQTNSNMYVRAAYEIMFFKPPTLDNTGALSSKDPDWWLVMLTQNSIDSEMKKLQFKTQQELLAWTDADGVDNFIGRVIDKVKVEMEKVNKPLTTPDKNAVRRAVQAHFSLIEKIVEHSPTDAINKKELDGQYDSSDIKLFDRIREGKANGIPMTCGTTDKVSEGLVDGHAYTLCDAYKKNIGGKEFMFVKLRNPWGSDGREYKLNDEGVLEGYAADCPNGYLELELHDYINNFTDTRIVGRSKKEKATDELEDNLRKALDECRDVTIQSHLIPGQRSQTQKTYRLDSVFRKETGGVERAFIKLVSADPNEKEEIECALSKFYNSFETPQVGAVNPEKKKLAEEAAKKREEEIAADVAKFKAKQEEYLKNNPEAELEDPGIKEQYAARQADINHKMPYVHLLGNLKNCLARTDGKGRSGSDEYYNMQNALKQMRKQFDDPKTQAEALKDASSELGRTARAYLRHCQDVSRMGIRRKERVELAKKLLLVSEMYDIGVEDPQQGLKSVISRDKVNEYVAENLQRHPVSTAPEDLRKHIAGMLVDKYADIALGGKDNGEKARAEKIRSAKSFRDKAIDQVLNSEPFKTVYGKKDAAALMKDIKKGEAEVYGKVTKEYNRELSRQQKLKEAQKKPVREFFGPETD